MKIFVNMKIYLNRLIFLSLTLSVCLMGIKYLGADIKFGNTQSSIYLNNNGTLQVDSNNFVVDGGEINQSDTGSITGNQYSFDRGTLASFLSSSFINGYYEPNIANIPALVPYIDPTQLTYGALVLTFNPTESDFIIANPGGLRYMLYVASGSQYLRGQPLFFGKDDIVLAPGALLAIAIQNTLNTNIILNNGYLYLQDDLRLGDNATLKNGGVVVFNNRKFSLGGGVSTWDDIIVWKNALDIQLNNQTILNGTWAFNGDAQINGNGNVLDISSGGTIYVEPNSTLRLSSVNLKGLGVGFFLMDTNSTLILSDVNIEMNGNYTFESGNVSVIGDSHVITKNYILEFAETSDKTSKGTLTVDGVAFTYDPLSYNDRQNVRPTPEQDPTHKFLNILKNGSVRAMRVESIAFTTLQGATATQGANAALQRYIILWPERPMIIYAGVDNNNQFIYDFTVDGKSQFLGFTSSETPLLTVNAGVHVTFENILFRDFSPKHLKFEKNSSLVFGNNSQIRVWENDTLNYPWVFQGNTTIFGSGAIITLGEKGAIVLKGKNSKLLIEGITIKGINGNNIRCEDDSSVITLQDMTWVQNGNYTFGKGSLQVLNDVTLMGPGYNFNFATDKACTINTDSDMQFMWGITLNYLSKNTNLLQMVDHTSVLSFNASNLSAPNGIQLTRGRLIIQGDSYSYNSTSGAIIFGDGTPAGNLLFDRTAMFAQQSGNFIDETVGTNNGGGGSNSYC
jgi:hypothetical protein